MYTLTVQILYTMTGFTILNVSKIVLRLFTFRGSKFNEIHIYLVQVVRVVNTASRHSAVVYKVKQPTDISVFGTCPFDILTRIHE